MGLLMAARVVAVFCTGLFAGILLGDRMGASFARPKLDPSSFVQFQQVQHVYFARMMPVLIAAAILGGLTWLFSGRSTVTRAEFWLVAVATGAVVVIFALTLAVNVPINKQLMSWSVAAPPADVMRLWAPWERVHTVRTIIALVAFGLEVMAFGLASLHAGSGPQAGVREGSGLVGRASATEPPSSDPSGAEP